MSPARTGRGLDWWLPSANACRHIVGSISCVTPISRRRGGTPTASRRFTTHSMALSASSSGELPFMPSARAIRARGPRLTSRLKRSPASSSTPLERPWCAPATVEHGWASEWMTPRPFWQAVAPMGAAMAMAVRAARSEPLRWAARSPSATRRIPPSAIESAIGCQPRASRASTQWVSASSPVAAVSQAGMSRCSSGSMIATLGIRNGLKTATLTLRSVSTTTVDRPTSEPVPAVVGMAMRGVIVSSISSCPPSASS